MLLAEGLGLGQLDVVARQDQDFVELLVNRWQILLHLTEITVRISLNYRSRTIICDIFNGSGYICDVLWVKNCHKR